MTYTFDVTKVVSGVLVAGITYSFAATELYTGRLFVEMLILTLGLAVAVHGLFTGIETATSESPE